MAASNPSQLFLLADHIKLSLLERQRAISLNLEPNSHDGQISRSLESLQSGIEALEKQDDETLQDQLTRLKSQLSDLQSQFHGFAPKAPFADPTITSPNSSSLAADFSAAQRTPSKSPRPVNNKSVRFSDASSPPSPDPSRAALFPSRYTDEPPTDPNNDQSNMDNQQIHAYHSNVLREQDAQLDTLGQSIGRQRELSMQIGDELDEQAVMLGDVEEGVDRHTGQLSRARTRVDKISRKARENWSMTVIIVLIVILVLLIVILK